MQQLILWTEWSKAISELRSAFSRQTTFLWMAVFCSGLAIRCNTRGVSSIVDSLGLKANAYDSLLRLLHSRAIDLEKLVECWISLCFRIFSPVCVEGYMVLFGDGIKIGKEGKKMPAVKLMHQSSQSNSKAEYIMGHYLQSLSLAVKNHSGSIAAIPLLTRIHDGLVFSNRSRETVINRFGSIVKQTCDAAGIPAIVVADAYYANRTMVDEASEIGGHLVSRVAHNTTAHLPAIQPKVRRRGRPAKKGPKMILASLFDDLEHETGDHRFSCRDLYWSPAKRIIRFVACENRSGGRIILMSTNLNLDSETIIRLYASRWLIESGFKTAVHEIGTFSYHFWMKEMKPTSRGQRKQYLHKETQEYREQVKRKIRAYHVFLSLADITHGLMLHLAINFKNQVFRFFNGWLRTIRDDVEPSMIVVSNALAATLPNYLRADGTMADWAKFMLEKSCIVRSRFRRDVA